MELYSSMELEHKLKNIDKIFELCQMVFSKYHTLDKDGILTLHTHYDKNS